MALTHSEQTHILVGVYMKLSKAFDQATDELCALNCSPSDKAMMQARVFGALLNDFISTLPGVTPEYIKQVVDHVFDLRQKILGKKSGFDDALPDFNVPAVKGIN